MSLSSKRIPYIVPPPTAEKLATENKHRRHSSLRQEGPAVSKQHQPLSPLVLTLLVACAGMISSLSPADGHSMECPPSQERPQGFYAYNTWLSLSDVANINLLGYAGEGPDTRPLMKKTLGDIRRDLESTLVRERWRELFGIPTFTYFAFMDSRFRTDDDEVVSVPQASLWCFAHEGDWILLSDGITHHYSYVYQVDRVRQRILFSDRWPDQIFLREGLNVAGVRAQFSVPDLKPAYDKLMKFKFPGLDADTSATYNQNFATWTIMFDLLKERESKSTQLVEITRSEFDRVAMGIITLNSFQLVDEYLAMTPDVASRAKGLVSFSVLATRSGDTFRDYASELAKGAFKAAADSGDEQLRTKAAATQLLLTMHQYYAAIERHDSDAINVHKASIDTLIKDIPLETAFKSWGAWDFYRIGNAAGRANQPKEAIWLFDRAITIDHSLEQAYLYRAVAKARLYDPKGVLEDTAAALTLNATKTKEVVERKLKRHPKDRQGAAVDEVELKDLRSRRLLTLEQKIGSLMVLGNCSDGESASEELMAAERAAGFAASAHCDVRAGRISSAKQKLEKAVSLENNPARRQLYELQLRNLSSLVDK